MGKRIFTAEQRSAIDTRNKTLLVSAAAGSGKTATLTERIIQSILDEKAPESIKDMLIVTFTNAAVKELRERITAALKEKLSENRENERLEREIYMLPSARICTIDSFCNEILKNNAEKFGIPPGYRIADKIEADILSHSIFEGLIEATYSGEFSEEICTPEEFELLTSALVGVKSDKALEEELALLYEHTKSLPNGVCIYKSFADYLTESSKLPPENNRYAKYGMDKAKNAAKHYLALYGALKRELDISDKNEGKYYFTLENDEQFFRSIVKAETYTEMKELLNGRSFKAFPSVREEKSEAMEKCICARNQMKKMLGEKCDDRYFTYSEQEWGKCLSELGSVMSVIYRFLKKFDELFFEEKRRRGVLEHSDIEKLAYKTLYTEDDEPSELAISMKEQFSSVYVDEYQDVNALQGKIFEAVANEHNRFMVGDIKQSIYGFRSAKPEIFARMKNDFPPLSSANSSPCASIFMSKNFRCDRGIVDFVNGIFDTVFDLAKESIGYVPEDRLEFAKTDQPEGTPYKEPEIMLFDKSQSCSADEDANELYGPSIYGEAKKAADLPPIWTANKIQELLSSQTLSNGDPVMPKDIAIILRKNGGRSKDYAEALKALGINTKLPDNKDFFLNAEIELALCLLNTIDNPMKDIYLAGLMCSPLYGFTPDELFFIRRFGKNGSLWESLTGYCEKENFEKGKVFIKKIAHYRAIAEGMPVDALILRLYKETGILTLAAKNGGKENLMLLYNYARKFEASSFEGLYSFINYINTVIESNAEFSAKKESGEENAVTITTIHKSKGLEYPIVFIADIGASLVSSVERRARVPYAEDFGAAMRMRVTDGLALVENPIFNAVMDYTADKTKEEELRVYYVALTRAREMLYISGVVPSEKMEDYIRSCELERYARTPYTLQKMKSFIDIIMMSKTCGILLNTDESAYPSEPVSNLSSKEAPGENDIEGISNSDLYKELIHRFEYEYPNKEMTTLPEKMSVSKLYPTVLDNADDHTVDFLPENEEIYTEDGKKPQRNGILPHFAAGSPDDESARRGIATHLVLQFADLSGFKNGDTEPELQRLLKSNFISSEDLTRVRKNEIDLFAQSDLYKEMLNAKKLHRELRFNIMLPATFFTQDKERKDALGDKKILLQGVIDCLIEDKNGDLHLVDYKTDRLSRAELSNKTLAEKKLREKHSLQLSYYALAIKEIFGKPPKTLRVYSLPLGDTVNIDLAI